jgi:hypothetical protein
MLTKKITHIYFSNFWHLWLIPLVTSATIVILWICHHCRLPPPLHPMKSLFPPLTCHFYIKNGIFLMHLWLLGHSLGLRPGLCLAALPLRPPQLMAERRRRRRRIKGGSRNLLSLPEDNKDNDGWGDSDNKGTAAEPT